MVKEFRFVIINTINNERHPTGWRSCNTPLTDVKHSAELMEQYRNGDEDVLWYIEYREV